MRLPRQRARQAGNTGSADMPGHAPTTNSPLRAVAASLFLLLAWSSSAVSQNPPQSAPAVLPAIRVDVDLVQFPVTVTDSMGRAFTGLKAENFRLFDNGIEQKIHHFSTEDVPFSMGLVLDRSGSMEMMIRDVYQAAFHTVRASKQEDEFFIAIFNHVYELMQDFSTDRVVLEKRLNGTIARGQTALWDAVFQALQHVEKGRFEKKALLVVTDGADNSSQVSFDDLLRYARLQEKVTIYAVGLFDRGFAGLLSRRSRDEKQAMALLTELAEAAGGKAYFPQTMDECKQVCIAIAKELRQQYSLGYYPEPKPRAGVWHSVEVQVQLPEELLGKLTPRTRAGYFAPRD